jgi:hypothetical protein
VDQVRSLHRVCFVVEMGGERGRAERGNTCLIVLPVVGGAHVFGNVCGVVKGGPSPFPGLGVRADGEWILVWGFRDVYSVHSSPFYVWAKCVPDFLMHSTDCFFPLYPANLLEFTFVEFLILTRFL